MNLRRFHIEQRKSIKRHLEIFQLVCPFFIHFMALITLSVCKRFFTERVQHGRKRNVCQVAEKLQRYMFFDSHQKRSCYFHCVSRINSN